LSVPTPTLSVVIAALNEADSIGAAIESVRGADEILVVDGGSTDGTPERASQMSVRVDKAPPSRGLQMAEGAGRTRGEWLLFLHADTRLGEGAVGAIRSFPADIVGGAFRLRFDSPDIAYRVIEAGVRLRTHIFRLPYGDQAIFCRRSAYDAVGGVPRIPLMEDVAFVRALGRFGRLAFPAIHATTSTRRYQRRGPLRSVASNLWLLARYFAGADVNALARAYRSR
jgi:rSAM/selenodomain-associated transferase 2